MADNLSRRQHKVLITLGEWVEARGYMPSVRELAAAMGVTAGTVQQHLDALKRKGFLASNGRAHGLYFLRPAVEVLERARGVSRESALEIPLVGNIAAGVPIEALENEEKRISMPRAVARPGDYFLRVKGRSMVDDGIVDGDLVLIRPSETVENGQVAVCLLEDGSATLKRVYREAGRIRLQPANADMAPIYVSDIRIQGLLVGLLRLYG